MTGLAGKRILLIVAGGIAAYKALELVRLLAAAGASVRAVLTEAGQAFVTPLSLQALTGQTVHTDLLTLTAESQMSHIELSRSADLLVVAPASADLLARMAAGMASDLATTLMLATDKDVLVAPAMNHRMWSHPATVANMATLRARGTRVIGPDEGAMACNEWGVGRLAEPPAIVAAIEAALGVGSSAGRPGRLAGRRALVTAGPTREPIDPVRFLANRSSGRQGYAIAAALAREGALVTLVSGPTACPAPDNVSRVDVETASEMLDACEAARPVEIAVFAAAVADWRVRAPAARKLKKTAGDAPALALEPNVDILHAFSAPGPQRPALVIGFAAETDDLIANAAAKRARKGCDWIVANDVRHETGNMGGPSNEVHLVSADGVEDWPRLAKEDVADRLVARIAARFEASAR